MKNTIGTHRTVLLAILIAVNAAFYALDNMYLSEEYASANRNLRSLQSEVKALKRDTRQIVQRNKELDKMAGKFEDLVRQGYLNNQNRVTVREGFDFMASTARIIDAEYSVSRAQIVENKFLKDAGYNLLKSDVEVRLSAIDDMRLYDFAYLVVHKYPGITNLIDFSVKKKSEVTASVLRRMNSSEPQALVTGRLEFSWYSIAPAKDNKEGEG